MNIHRSPGAGSCHIPGQKTNKQLSETPKVNIRVLGNRLLLELDTRVRTNSPLILEHTTKADPKYAWVRARGVGVRPEIQVGQYVLWSRWNFQEVEVDGQKYRLVRDQEILGIADSEADLS